MPTTGAEPAAVPEEASLATPGATGLLAGLPLETERLILRPLALADAPVIERLAGEWEVARFTGNIPHPYPAGAAVTWIAESWAEGAADRKSTRLNSSH